MYNHYVQISESKPKPKPKITVTFSVSCWDGDRKLIQGKIR